MHCPDNGATAALAHREAHATDTGKSTAREKNNGQHKKSGYAHDRASAPHRTPSKSVQQPRGMHVICQVCDFFHPSVGGVEQHIWSLSQCLLKLGCKVVVVTHAYNELSGVRVMTGGLKVFYVPMVPFTKKVAFPTYTALLPIFREILIREGVTIVHGHQVSWVGNRFQGNCFRTPLSSGWRLPLFACRRRLRWRMNAFCKREVSV